MNKINNLSKIDIAHGIIFSELNLKKDSFDDRLLCQKKIYLLQELGLTLGYNYNWYVHGPYSPMLTEYIYSKMDFLLGEDFSKYKFKGKYHKMIDMVNSLENDKKYIDSSFDWYELLASLVYLCTNSSVWEFTNDEDIISKLIELKPKYDNNICEYAMGILRERLVIN